MGRRFCKTPAGECVSVKLLLGRVFCKTTSEAGVSRKIAAEAGVYDKIADVAGVSVKLLLGKVCLLNCFFSFPIGSRVVT